MNTIFVQIAAYRDTELPHTIRDCIEKADKPGRLRFGVCWQYDEETSTDLDPYISDSRFRIDKIHYSESRGACWARNRTNQLYNDESFTLQIDSHMRFAPGWDVKLIEMLNSIDYEKPLLTTYPPSYKLKDGRAILAKENGVYMLKLKKLRLDLSTKQEGVLKENQKEPGKSELLAAGFIFTLGQFCKEVEYDPNIYFQGEEISIAARAYTHGYNLYYPHENVIWHLYHHQSPLHWADHKETFREMENQGLGRLEKLFLGDHTQLGKYGLGERRTLSQFEEYANINFSEVIQRRKKGPQQLLDEIISLYTDELDRDLDYEFWHFSLLDNEERVIYQHYIYDPAILEFRSNQLQVKETVEGMPVCYSIWPKTSAGWGKKYTYPLNIGERSGEKLS